MIRSLALPRGRAVTRGLGHAALLVLGVIGLIEFASGAMIPAKAYVAQILLERAFERSIATHQPQRPWSWADMAPVAKITVPRLGVTRIVIDTGSGQAMAFGPTLLPNSAPLDETGTSVVAAHRDTHFRFLKDARPGDAILVEGLDGATRRYRITGSRVVRWDRFAISADRSTHRLALATCYPFGSHVHGPLRYVVSAEADVRT